MANCTEYMRTDCSCSKLSGKFENLGRNGSGGKEGVHLRAQTEHLDFMRAGTLYNLTQTWQFAVLKIIFQRRDHAGVKSPSLRGPMTLRYGDTYITRY